MDVSEPRTAAEKAAQLLTAEVKSVEQAKQLENPDSAIAFQLVDNASLLSQVAAINYGSKPGQTNRVVRFHWEFCGVSSSWQLLESTPTTDRHYSGKIKVCLTLEEITAEQGIREFGIRSQDVWGKKGIIQSQMKEMPSSIYCSNIFDNNTSVLTEKDKRLLVLNIQFHRVRRIYSRDKKT